MPIPSDSEASTTDDEGLFDTVTEIGLDKWHRLPGEFDLFKGDGRPDTKFLAIGDAKLPVFDELTSWMKRSNKPPPDEIFRDRSGFHPEDAEKNYMVAEKRFNMDIPVPGVQADLEDREFYDRWAETLDFRWNHDFADLRLRRTKSHGWKWRLIRIRPDGSIVVCPFIKPAQRPFRERGQKSTDVSRNRVHPHALLDTMRAQAQSRWKGMPITDKEEQEDRAALNHLRYIEGLKNNYGFLGEMLCGMAADTGSGVRILVIGFLAVFTLLFCYGPPTLLPYLSEFVTAVLPLQATLRGILTSANDMNRVPGDPYTEGNVRQWLLYWPFYQFLRFVQGWVYLVRPNWYRVICGWRTLLCLCCTSPFFGDRSIHPADAKESDYRLLTRIWRDRGERMAEEVAAFQAQKVLATVKGGKSPQSGRKHNGGTRFSPFEHAQMLLNEARMLHGLIEETWRGGEIATRKMASATSGTSLREAIHNLTKVMDVGKDLARADPKKQEEFEQRCKELERAIGKTYTGTRSQAGAEAFRTHLKHLYQASDESISQYLHALSIERGVVNSRRNGANKAWSNKDLREHHSMTQRREVVDHNDETKVLVEAEKPFYDPEYSYDPQKSLSGLTRQLKDDFRRAVSGDMTKRNEFINDPAKKQKIHEQMRNAGYGGQGFDSRQPWNPAKFAPNAAFSEDMSSLIAEERRHPGTGLIQRPGIGAAPDAIHMFNKLTPEQRMRGMNY